MTLAVDMGRKATKTNKQTKISLKLLCLYNNFCTNFPVLLSPLSQFSTSEVEFKLLDQYFSLAFSP